MIQFVTLDVEQVKAELISRFENALGESLYPSDERAIFLFQFIPIVVGLVSKINESANQNLLRYARDLKLDEIGYLTNTERLEDAASSTYLKFILSAAQAIDIQIPIGTRATPNYELYFETTQSASIPSGQTEVIIPAKCMERGSIGNGFEIGQIKHMVDQIPFVASVINTTVTVGGSNKEDDDSYRERIQLSPESLSTAGSEDGYKYWAKTADKNIGDVEVDSPSDATIKIIAIMKDGSIPSQAVLDKITAATSSKKVRPLTDKVTVQGPTVVNYAVNLTYYISKDRETEVTSITAAINQAVIDYNTWQSTKLGRAISPDELRKRLFIAGASRVTMTAPSYTTLTKGQVGKVTTSTVTYGGLE